jgi:hypothetical protein
MSVGSAGLGIGALLAGVGGGLVAKSVIDSNNRYYEDPFIGVWVSEPIESGWTLDFNGKGKLIITSGNVPMTFHYDVKPDIKQLYIHMLSTTPSLPELWALFSYNIVKLKDTVCTLTVVDTAEEWGSGTTQIIMTKIETGQAP